MSISVDQFLQQLVQSGLMSDQDVSDYLRTRSPEKMPVDGDDLAGDLVQDKRLTKFQAVTIYRGNRVPLVFGDYIAVSKLGRGGMGKVFQAVHRKTGQPAAIKMLHSDALASNRAVRRFQQEADVATRLNHPNIVATYGVGQVDVRQYLIMEYVEGQSLSALLEKEGSLPFEQTLDYVLQAARGLQHAHQRRTIHRDVKPSNLLLDKDGTVKILDMGLARIEEPQQEFPIDATLAERLTQKGVIMGTVDYMSPEQAIDTRRADHRSDVYSLGCTIYRLVVGKPVYEAESDLLVIMAHCEAEIPSLADSPCEIPSRLEDVFRHMVAKNPDDRFQSMAEVIEQLESCCAPDLPKLPRSDRGHRTTGQSLNLRSGETTVFDPYTPSGSPLSGLPTSSTTRQLPPASLHPLDKKSVADTIGQRDGNTVKMKQDESSVPQSSAREAASTPRARSVSPAVKKSPSGSRDHSLTITPFPGPKKRRSPQVVLLGGLIGIATAVVLAGLIYWLTGNL